MDNKALEQAQRAGTKLAKTLKLRREIEDKLKLRKIKTGGRAKGQKYDGKIK